MRRSVDAAVCGVLIGLATLYWLVHDVPPGHFPDAKYWQYPEATRLRDVVVSVVLACAGGALEVRAALSVRRGERARGLLNAASGAVLLLASAYGKWMIDFLDMVSGLRS